MYHEAHSRSALSVMSQRSKAWSGWVCTRSKSGWEMPSLCVLVLSIRCSCLPLLDLPTVLCLRAEASHNNFSLYHLSCRHRSVLSTCGHEDTWLILTQVCSGNFLHALAVVKVAGPHAADNIRNWCIGTLALTFAWVLRGIIVGLRNLTINRENLYCASMIASHIWRHQRNMRTTSTRDLSASMNPYYISKCLHPNAAYFADLRGIRRNVDVSALIATDILSLNFL